MSLLACLILRLDSFPTEILGALSQTFVGLFGQGLGALLVNKYISSQLRPQLLTTRQYPTGPKSDSMLMHTFGLTLDGETRQLSRYRKAVGQTLVHYWEAGKDSVAAGSLHSTSHEHERGTKALLPVQSEFVDLAEGNGKKPKI